MQKTPEQVHPLANLYRALSSKTQESLATNTGLPLVDFEKRLQAASNTFAQWRYFYENKKMNDNLSASVDFLARLAHATQKIIAATPSSGS